MKWPWVARARYEEAERGMAMLRAMMDAHYQQGGDNLIRVKAAEERAARADATADRFASMAEIANARYDSLLEKFTALRLAGAVVPEPVPLPIERKRDPCAEAILAKAGRDTALQSLMFEQLAKDRAAGKNETEILRAIQTGEAPDPWTMPA